MGIAFDGRSLAEPVLRGMDRYLVGLASALERRGVRVSLLHRARQPLNEEHLEGLRADLVPVRDVSGLHWEQVALPWAIGRGGYDLYHAPCEHGVPLMSPRPIVMTVHSVTQHSYLDLVESGRLPGTIKDYLGFSASPYSFTFPNLYWRSQVARANHILTPSQFTRDETIRFLGLQPDRVTVTPLAVPQAFTGPPTDSKERARTLEALGVTPPYLLYVGGFEPHKNVPGLLRTFVRVREARPELSLVVVGSKTPPTELRQQAVRCGLHPGEGPRFLANISDELVHLYDGAEAFVSLSWRESFGLPALEALSRGCPVVVSEWGAAREVVGESGILLDPRDEERAASAILALLKRSDREERASRGRETAARFSWDRTADATLAVYEQLVRGRRGTS